MNKLENIYCQCPGGQDICSHPTGCLKRANFNYFIIGALTGEQVTAGERCIGCATQMLGGLAREKNVRR